MIVRCPPGMIVSMNNLQLNAVFTALLVVLLLAFFAALAGVTLPWQVYALIQPLGSALVRRGRTDGSSRNK